MGVPDHDHAKSQYLPVSEEWHYWCEEKSIAVQIGFVNILLTTLFP
jgi:hypothetical protein